MGPAPPQWFMQFMAAPPQWLAQLIGNADQMQANFNHVNQMQANLHADFNQMRASLMRVEALQVNARISRLNKLEMDSNTGDIVYRVKQKEVAGDGTALANNLLVQGIAPLAALQVVPAVGTAIGATINLNGLTHQAILRLIQFYNYDFGIRPGELLVAIRLQRVLNWLTTDV